MFRCEERQVIGIAVPASLERLARVASSTSMRVLRIDNSPQVRSVAVHAIPEVSGGTAWVGGSRLVAFAPGADSVEPRTHDFPLREVLSETRVKSILQTQDGTLWGGTVSGLQRMIPGTPAFERLPGIRSPVRALREMDVPVQAASGTQQHEPALWIGTIGRGTFT